jgi:hypothetical protein
MCPTTPIPKRKVDFDCFAILELDQERRQRREMKRSEIGDLVPTRKIRSLTFDQEETKENKRQCCQVRLSFENCMDDEEQSPRSMASYDDENPPSLVEEVSGLSMPVLRPRKMGYDVTNLPYSSSVLLSSRPATYNDLPFMPM